MTRTYLRKADWHIHLREGIVSGDELVKLWVHPHGCLCQIEVIDGLPVLINGRYTAVNTTLAKMLYEAGIVGDIIIHSTEIIPQNTARWLTWWLSTSPEEGDPLLRSITVTTLSLRPTNILPFQIEVIEPVEIRASEVMGTMGMKARDARVSQFVVERNNGSMYRLEPTRRVDATILDCTRYGYVLRTDNGLVFITPMVSRRVQGQIQHYNLKPEDLVGTRVKIQYTMFTEGKRLCNYKSPIVYRSSALESMGTGDIPSYEGSFVFDIPTRENNASLTATRCARAEIRFADGIISGVDTESDTTLFTFTKGVVPGVYEATFEVDGRVEKWRFESPYAVDALDPSGFVGSVESNIFYATGFSLRALGLSYVDHTQQSMIA